MTTEKKLTAKQSKLVAVLVTLFKAADEAGREADAKHEPEDGGTSNFDTPAFKLPRVPQHVIEEAAKQAGLSVCDFSWFGGKRWYWLNVTLHGQGNRRSRMSQAAYKRLQSLALTECPEMDVCHYQQAD